MSVLGNLLFNKLAFGAFVGPAIALLLVTPVGRSTKQWLYKRVLCQPEYVDEQRLDTEMAGIVMLLEIPLVQHLHVLQQQEC